MTELKWVRRRRGDLPQEALASWLGVVTGSVEDWEAGRDYPSTPHLMAWGRALGLRVAVTKQDGSEIPIENDPRAAHECTEMPCARCELRRLAAASRTARTSDHMSRKDLAAQLGVPPGTSKWNRIEHRLFSHISINWTGQPLTSHEVAVNLIAGTKTRTGLAVHAELDTGAYPRGIKITDREMKELMKQHINPHTFHGEWNYDITGSETPE